VFMIHLSPHIDKCRQYAKEQPVNALKWLMTLAVLLSYLCYADVPWTNKGRGYYQHLGRAFEQGHTYIDMEPHPLLLNAENPYLGNKERRQYVLWDATYYEGRYYLYFGTTPIVTVWLPVRLLTGFSLGDRELCFLLSSAGTCFLLCLLIGVTMRYAPNTPVSVLTIASAAICFSTWIPHILRRPSVYEVSIFGAYCYVSLGILLLWKSTQASTENKSTLLAAAGSLCLGLAACSRITHIFAVIIPLTILYIYSEKQSFKELVTKSVPLLLPWATCIAMQALYNYMRFNSIFETGYSYQISDGDFHETYATHWKLSSSFLGIYDYFFKPYPAWALNPFNRNFGALTGEKPFGIIRNTPFVLWAIWLIVRRKAFVKLVGDASPLFVGVALYTAIMLTLMLFFGVRINRFLIDFAPYIMLFACFGYVLTVHETVGAHRRLIINMGLVAMLIGVYVVLGGAFCGLKPCSSEWFPLTWL
jgi:hypothetical protein